MPRTTRFDPGAIVLVRFPFTDLSQAKQRPAVALGSLAHQRSGRDVIVAAVSGARVDEPGPFDHVVDDWRPSGLLMPSVVRCGKLVTLERSMVVRVLGALPRSELDSVRRLVASAIV